MAWCSIHDSPEPCYVCNMPSTAAPAEFAAGDFQPVPVPVGVLLGGVPWLVDPVMVERVRRTMMGDLLWLADLLAGLCDGECACGGECPA
jgi:hypothetical protein